MIVTGSKTAQECDDRLDVGQVGEQMDPTARPVRRTFTAEDRAQLVAEYEAEPHGQKSAVLRREGHYQSTAREWMQARDAVARDASRPTRRHGGSGRAGGIEDAGKLRAENARLTDHLARWVDDLVDHGLDLAAYFDHHTELRGAPPDDPRLMLKLLIYGYSNGITSSRDVERRCHHDVAFMFLTAQAAPDFVVISWFRTRHLKAFTALFTQALWLCAQAGLVSLGNVALDGSKIGASASRHPAMRYDRMVRAEGELAGEVEALLADAESKDASENGRPR